MSIQDEYETSPTPGGGVVNPAHALDADGDGQPDYLDAWVEEGPLTALQRIPQWLRLVLYVVYSIGGPVLIYLQGRGIVGADELALWAGVGSVLGLTAAGNVTR